MARIALINPRFDPSYWGQEYTMPIFGRRANMPVASLPLLAALTPSDHSVMLIDENVEPLDFDDLKDMDIVGVTGMTVQRFRMKAILTELKRRGHFTVVGGAWVTVQEDYFGDLADVIFVGEAEETWPSFLQQWAQGCHKTRYEQSAKTDMSTVPTPRFDLLKMNRYLYGTIQVSRGCPFLCEFCDIIVTFGRRPRMKLSSQVIAELDSLRKLKIGQVFIVDDNFIGNKHAIKPILMDLIAYQEQHGYPFRFLTEATLDLAEDDELIQLMLKANIWAVFIGIETPNEASLRETRKHQNVRTTHGTMLARLERIQRAGLEVACGMIVGFDNDDESIFSAQEQFIEAAHIPHVMLGMLHAIPKTPLHERLKNEGRLDQDDVSNYGTNVIPLRMSRDALRDGYINVMNNLHSVQRYFSRIDWLYLDGNLGREQLGRTVYLKSHRVAAYKATFKAAVASISLFSRLMSHVREPVLRQTYRSRCLRVMKVTRDVNLLVTYIVKCAIHYHSYKLADGLTKGRLVSTM